MCAAIKVLRRFASLPISYVLGEQAEPKLCSMWLVGRKYKERVCEHDTSSVASLVLPL